MFRKIIYFTMMILGVLGLLSLLFLPIYKFDEEKIFSNYSEYHYLITSRGEGSYDLAYDNEMINTFHHSIGEASYPSKEERDLAINNYLIIMEEYYAAMNGDNETFKEKAGYEILNSVLVSFKKQINNITDLSYAASSIKDSINNLTPLSVDSSAEVINTFKMVLDNALGVLKDEGVIDVNKTIDDAISDEAINLMNNIKQNIITYLGGEEKAYENISNVGIYDVMQHLYLQYDDIVSGEDIQLMTDTFKERGIHLTTIVATWQNLIARYKVIIEADNLAEKSFIDKVKDIFGYSYNTLPLEIISLICITFLFQCIRLFFGGLKGINGKKRPKVFFKSLIVAAIGAGLFVGLGLISSSNMLAYHNMEWSRLFMMVNFGHFSYGLLFPALASLLSLGISIFGIFCYFGKKNKE